MSALPPIALDHALALGIVLFGAGVFAVLTRRSALGVLCGAVLMVQAAGLQLVAYSALGRGSPTGALFSALLFVTGAAHAFMLAALAFVLRRRRS